jgi:DNA-binding NarL/FixJ family response regulator
MARRDGLKSGHLTVLQDLRSWLAEGVIGVESPSAPRLRAGELTGREVEILGLLAQGRSDGEIAEALFISPKTVSVHVSNAKGKLGATSRLDLALRARDLLAGP